MIDGKQLQEINDFRLSCMANPQFIKSLKAKTNDAFNDNDIATSINLLAYTQYGSINIHAIYFHYLFGKDFLEQIKTLKLKDKLFEYYSLFRKMDDIAQSPHNTVKALSTVKLINSYSNKHIIQPDLAFHIIKILLNSPCSSHHTNFIILKYQKRIWKCFCYEQELEWLLNFLQELLTIPTIWNDEMKIKLLIYQLMEPFHRAIFAVLYDINKITHYKKPKWYCMSTLYVMNPIIYNDDAATIQDILNDPQSHARLIMYNSAGYEIK
jgi:hypothetical protein